MAGKLKQVVKKADGVNLFISLHVIHNKDLLSSIYDRDFPIPLVSPLLQIKANVLLKVVHSPPIYDIFRAVHKLFRL